MPVARPVRLHSQYLYYTELYLPGYCGWYPHLTDEETQAERGDELYTAEPALESRSQAQYPGSSPLCPHALAPVLWSAGVRAG